MSKAKIVLLGLLTSGCAVVWVPAAVPRRLPSCARWHRGRHRSLRAPGTVSPPTFSSTPTEPRYGGPAEGGPKAARARRAASERWQNVTAAKARGFNTHLAKRAPGDNSIGYLHAEHRRFSADRHILDVKRPESLIYATQPGQRPVLIGVMFSVPRGVRGPTPAGPIDRWHSHLVWRRHRRHFSGRRVAASPARIRRRHDRVDASLRRRIPAVGRVDRSDRHRAAAGCASGERVQPRTGSGRDDLRLSQPPQRQPDHPLRARRD